MSSKANFDFKSHLKIFCAHFKSNHHVSSNAFFGDFEAILMKIDENHQKIITSARLSENKLIGAVSDDTTHLVGKLWSCATLPKLI